MSELTEAAAVDPSLETIPPPTTSPHRTIWQLAGPAVALNALQMVNGMLDAYYIGQLPKASLTAHGGSLNIIFMMFSLLMTLSVASTALVSRAFGAGDKPQYRLAAKQCVAVGQWLGIALMILCVVCAIFVAPSMVPPDDHEAQHLIKTFVLAFSLSLPTTTVIQVLAGAMRGIGDTKSPMIISGIQILLHMLLNVFLIFPTRLVHLAGASFTLPGANLGLAGAAVALAISALVSLVIYLIWVGSTPLGQPFGILWPDSDWAKRILKISGPAAAQAILRVLSFTVFTFILRGVPNSSDALAALRVGIAIEAVLFMPAFGLSIAAGALVGQNLGAKRPENAEHLGWIASHHAALVMFLCSIPLFIFAPQFASILSGSNKPEIAKEAALYIRILIPTEVLFGYAMVLIGALQGAGDTKRPMWITIGTLWGMRVPLALFLAAFMGTPGCWLAMSVSQGVQGIISAIVWKRGQWKTIKV